MVALPIVTKSVLKGNGFAWKITVLPALSPISCVEIVILAPMSTYWSDAASAPTMRRPLVAAEADVAKRNVDATMVRIIRGNLDKTW